VSAQQQQISARHHQNTNNEETRCARESKQTSVSLQHGTYRLRHAQFDNTSKVRTASTATADAMTATTTTRKRTVCGRARMRKHSCQRNNNKSTRNNIKTQTMKKLIVRS
jgi:hypothetical protein